MPHRYKIRASSWTPVQQRSAWRIKRQVDCYFQKGLKWPETAIFHSRAEILFAGLLETDPTVTSYCPQPMTFRIGSNTSYTPDFYVNRHGAKEIYELKPRGEFEKEWLSDLIAVLETQGFQFVVLPNEWCFKREIRAENSWRIVRFINACSDLDTDELESRLIERVENDERQFGSLVNMQPGEPDLYSELACFRLLVNRKISINLDQHLNYNTLVSLANELA